MIVTKNRASLEGFKKYWWGLPRSVVYVIVFSVLVAFNALEILAGSILLLFNGEGALTSLILSMLLMAFGVYCLIKHSILVPHRLYESSQKLSPNIIETICFNENGFIAENVGERLSERVENAYDSITRAFYKNGWFVIYCDKMRGYTIHSGSFVQGDPQQLTAFLTNKLGTRFKVK